MNSVQLWYCDLCDKTINFSSRLRHNNSKPYKHKKELVLSLKIRICWSRYWWSELYTQGYY